jgi:two-component system chemotaxis response regulator CheB
MDMSDTLDVLVVDDSAIYRSLIQGCLREIPGVACVGSAPDGRKAIEMAAELEPDVVLLDLEMPVLDGVASLPDLQRVAPRAGIIMVSSLTTKGADVTMAALQGGAFDFVTKPQVRAGEDGFAALRGPLERAIAAFRESRRGWAERQQFATGESPVKVPEVDLVVVGVSTGGPSALAQLVPRLPGALAVPVLVVQHMPPRFTASLADSLDRKSGLRVREAEQGLVPGAGEVLIARGGRHLVVRGGPEPYLDFSDDEPVNSFRPSVDVLFESAATAYSGRVLSVVMTGMGADGLEGVRAVRNGGGYCLAQDRESCAVYGMPRSVIQGGQADEIVSLGTLAARIEEIVAQR